MRKLFLAALCCTTLMLAACGGSSSDNGTSAASGASAPMQASAPAASTLSAKAQLGEKIFFDKGLSGNKNMACASCHDPAFAYGPPNSLSVQLGSDPAQAGVRAVPSLRYKSMTPPYDDNADNPDGVTQNAPGGGFMWDGRATSLATQPALPLLNPIEMNNSSPDAVVKAVRSASYAALFQQVYGQAVFGDTTTTFNDIGDALQQYQIEDPSFAPYSSKFDLYLGNKIGGTLTAAELHGLQLFNDTTNGAGCAACHFVGANFHGSVGLMTDFTYQAIGAPRNDASIPNNPDPIPANASASFIDMGLCGPYATLHVPGSATSGAGPDPLTGVNVPDPYCGRFKVPTLRNVASRNAFFHNGVFHSLVQVVNFYNTRDTNPEFWYPSTGGSGAVVNNPGFALQPTYTPGAKINRFNDLPVAYQGNIDEELPMGQGQTDAGGATAADGAKARPFHGATQLTQKDVSDLICFLKTLSDGYQQPAQAASSGDCVN
ncbi:MULTISPECIES: cytochrome-c peroxidase [unclassified Caballeronia]|uniref:cytochrome-c peroxidase n=1 Tax=unclassified Caballeronia TaxID=2646786 RepID=UPI001F480121|nr:MULTISPECIES: cytochrome c peroxidase [unclassified Caballeronia]MCE4545849.1 cytochrome-c peroxidase [Caballeronia sp. PC1]MCE4572029.1 cytochrome-c peroxidase [Caballeronia sp. CLC5]